MPFTKLKGKKIGLGITGSFCNFSKLPDIIKKLKDEGAEILPIFTSDGHSFFHLCVAICLMLHNPVGLPFLKTQKSNGNL